MTVRFYVNRAKPQSAAARERLAVRARSLGFDVRTEGPADTVLALGGDGTILRAVHEFPGTPVLGFNLGGLGYLSSVEERHFDEALERLARGEYRISERCMLSADGRHAALNDIVIARADCGHAVRLDLEADGKLVTGYMADGLIIATPTGSTAYSLAAGGPVLMPDSDSIVITPSNPHALGVRPLVVRNTVRLVVTVRSRTDGNASGIRVHVDGENVMELQEGMSVEIARAAVTAKLIELEGCDPYDVLARKLGWSGSNVK